MRIFLSAALGLTLFGVACGNSSNGTSGSSGGVSTSAGAGSTGGTTGTVGAGTTGGPAGTTGGLLAAGSQCTSNAVCQSNVCGTDGTGSCCGAACSTSDANCGATSCDDSGTCQYPSSSASCGAAAACSDSMLTSAGTCNGSGTCIAGTQSACAENYGCNAAGTACNTVCTASTDCASGFYCATAAGTCNAPSATGPCTENDACTSGVCGINGTGHCCTTACTNTTAPCGAIDCDNTSGACTLASAGTACGSITETCTNGTQQNPSACDGAGNCNNSPGTTSCTPYICGNNACLATCTDNTSCGSTDFCDVANTTCCPGLAKGDVLAVDSTNGNDTIPCCGIGANGPCQTLNQAMKLIDSSTAQGVTIAATVNGAGGDWTPKNEVYPIALGWGAELNAPGVNFTDTSGNAEIFDIKKYSANDTVASASIVGTPANQVSIGMDSLGNQSTDTSAIEVEPSGTLYIANATVNGNASMTTTAITVNAGGTLWLAEDQAVSMLGTVTIGNNLDALATDGYNGIVCVSANGLGCTITDATLQDGGSSVVIEGQEGVDIDAEDNALIMLTSAPMIGIPPLLAGFETCAAKPDSSTALTEAILLNGSATMTFSNGTVQCISGNGFALQAADNLKSLPTLTLNNTTIQHTEDAVYATAGTATILGSTFQYNYNGVEQGTDSTNIATISLGGNGLSTNTVACCNSEESVLGNFTPGVCVLNTTTEALDADNVNWDTNNNATPPPDEPDLFSCTDATLSTCTCEDATMTCTNPGGIDNMDAVYISTGTVTQADAGLSTVDCTVEGIPCGNGCPPNFCCEGLTQKCHLGHFCTG